MPDLYKQRLQHAGWTWREDHSWHQGKHLKDRASGRADKRGARQFERVEIEFDAMDAPTGDPCADGTCAMCDDGGREGEYERTRTAAAQRGAI